MISFRMIALMAMVASLGACWPKGADETEAPVEEVVEEQITDAVTDVDAVDSVDATDVELEIVEEVQ
jgi:predicted small lipoprotein YifL